jgi:uncharacterized membrane protein YfcA
MALAVVVGGAAVQWLRHGHFNFSYLLGSAVGAMLGAGLLAALARRASKPQDH